MKSGSGARVPDPTELQVLQLAIERSCVTASGVRDGAVRVERMNTNHDVMRLVSPVGTTYWKAGRRVGAELRACRQLDAAGRRDLHPEVIVDVEHAVVGFEGFNGSTLGEFDTAEALDRQAFEDLGCLLAELEAIPTVANSSRVQEYLAPPLEWARDQSAAQLGVISGIQRSAELNQACRVLEALPRVFTHGDARPENVIVSNGSPTVRLIDWELAGARWPSFDLATALAHIVLRRLVPALAVEADSLLSRVQSTIPTRQAAAQLVSGFGRLDDHIHLALGFALAHLAFELAATAPRLTGGVTFLLDAAVLVASDERQWRVLLLPMDR